MSTRCRFENTNEFACELGLEVLCNGCPVMRLQRELAVKDAEIARLMAALREASNAYCAAVGVGPFGCPMLDIIDKALSASGEEEKLPFPRCVGCADLAKPEDQRHCIGCTWDGRKPPDGGKEQP